jgi:hypothetical protein
VASFTSVEHAIAVTPHTCVYRSYPMLTSNSSCCSLLCEGGFRLSPGLAFVFVLVLVFVFAEKGSESSLLCPRCASGLRNCLEYVLRGPNPDPRLVIPLYLRYEVYLYTSLKFECG